MRITLTKWGNSLGIRLPKFALELLELKRDQKVELDIKNSSIIISKPQDLSIEELAHQITKENKHKVINFGKPTGKEIW